MIVGDLLPDPRRPGSTRVVIDGRLAWTVPADVIAGLGLAIGRPVGGEAIARLDRAADEEGAVRSALRALERRAHGAVELGRKLARKGHPAEAVEAALERLDRLGLLDDLGFARTYATARSARGRGPARLRQDLLALGVAAPVVARAVSELQAETEDPLEQPLALARKRAAALRGVPPEARRRRLVAFLARRGFRGSEVRSVLEQVLKEG